MASRLVLFAPLMALVVPAPASAERLRHEYVPPDVLARFDPGRADSAILGSGRMPDAIRRDGARLDAPGPPGTDSPLVDPAVPPDDAPSIPRPDEARPDRQTGADSNLKYHVIYNPSVAPLRRNVAFDRVERDYRLTIAPTRRRPVRVIGERTPRPGRELFWGDMKVDFAGADAPLPSVAPDMRILALRTEPPDVPVQFVADGADNVYVRSPYRGEVRLIFLVDADQAYFSSPVPGNVLLGHQSGGAGTDLPPRARRAAEAVLKRLEVSPEMPFDQGLDALVAWFRSFEAGPPPDASGDIYRDLALGQVGVCRHRAFAFMITARAAGVPTRVVHNEAHAFVEVMAPDGRWRRIDLGGEAPELSIGGGDGRRLHQPTPDPFPKPEAWQNQYSSMLTQGAPPASDGDGPRPDIEGAPPGLGPGSADEGESMAGGDGPGGEGEGSDGSPTVTGADGAGAPIEGADDGAGVAGEGQELPPEGFTPPEGLPAEVPLPAPMGQEPALAEETIDVQPLDPATVTLAVGSDADELDGFRGEPLGEVVRGRVAGLDGDGLSGVKVQLYLVPDGPGDPVPVGRAVVSGADGRYEARIQLPATLRLGRYRLVAASAESERHAGARSDGQ